VYFAGSDEQDFEERSLHRSSSSSNADPASLWVSAALRRVVQKQHHLVPVLLSAHNADFPQFFDNGGVSKYRTGFFIQALWADLVSHFSHVCLGSLSRCLVDLLVNPQG
jgi:hypothetical protein